MFTAGTHSCYHLVLPFLLLWTVMIFSVYVETYIKLMTTMPVPTDLDTDVFIQLNYKVCATSYQKDHQSV